MAESEAAFSQISASEPPLATPSSKESIGDIELVSKPNATVHVGSPEHGVGHDDEGRSPLLDDHAPSSPTDTTININVNVQVTRPESQWRRRACRIAAFVVLGVVVVVVVLASLPKDKPLQSGPIRKKTTIMLSFDGFRYDYLRTTTPLPNIDALRANGVTAEWMQPIFPSKTFPNHYTLVTGLYAETHGIISNHMYDPVFNAYFSLDNGGPADGRWWGGDPIWNTIQRHGKRTNVMFWPVRALTVLRGIGLRDCVEAVCGGDWQGAEAEINGTRPTVYLPFVFSYPYEKRIQNILDWMALPEHSAPDLVLTYFDATDTEGHEYGPGSPQVVAAAQTLDAMVGMLMAGIRDLGAENHTNVIIVADHGMATITANRTIFLDDYIDMSTIQVIDWSPNVAILPRAPTTAKDVVNALSGVHPNLTVLLKEDIPDRFHYQSNRRITPVLGLADLGWSITTHAGFINYGGVKGDHGWDNVQPNMQAVFVAAGPDFRANVTIPPFPNRSVYPLLCHLLNVTASPNNGSLTDFVTALRVL